MMPSENSESNVATVEVPVENDLGTGILSGQELVPSVLTSDVASNPTELGKLTAQDLEDLEKIQAELDSLTSNLPGASGSTIPVDISNITEEVINTSDATFLDHVSYTIMPESTTCQSETVILDDQTTSGTESYIIQDTDALVGDNVTIMTEEVVESIMTETEESGVLSSEIPIPISEAQYITIDNSQLNDTVEVDSSSAIDSFVSSVTTVMSDVPALSENIIFSDVSTISTQSITTTSTVPSSVVKTSTTPTFKIATPIFNLPTSMVGTSTSTVVSSSPSVLGIQSVNPGQNTPFTVYNIANPSAIKGAKQVMLVQKPISSPTSGTSILAQSKVLSSAIGKSTVTTTIIPDTKISTTPKKPAPMLVPVSVAQNQNMLGSLPASLANFKSDTPIKVIMAQNSKGTGGNPVQITTSTMNFLQSLAGGGKNIITTVGGNQFLNKNIKIVSAPAGTQFANATGAALSGGNFITLAAGNQGTGAKVVQQQQPTILLASPKTGTTIKGNPQIIRAFSGNPNSKQSVVLLSPVKGKPGTFQNVTLKSPQKIAPAPNTLPSGSKYTIVTACTSSETASSTTTTALKPQAGMQKVILRNIVPVMKSGVTTSAIQTATTGTALKQVMVPVSRVLTAGSGVQPIQVPGNKFNYVRLVTAPNQGGSTAKTTIAGSKPSTIIPGTSIRSLTPSSQASVAVPISNSMTLATGSGSHQVRFTLNVSKPTTATSSQANTKVSLQPRLIIPGNVNQKISSFPPGSIIQTTNSSGQPNYVMVSAQYVAQLQQARQNSGGSAKVLPVIQPAPTVLQSGNTGANTFVPIASAPSNTQSFDSQSSMSQNASITPIPSMRQMNGRAPPPETLDNRPRKPCNCTKSQCLKLYCDCFANGEFCNNCNCTNCYNNLVHEEERQKAIKSCLDRNPMAFHPKIGKTRKGKDGDHERRHTKGCNCKRSGCLKNYCECYEAKILCTNLCRCSGCKNFEDSNERKTLMHLADAAEVRVQQQLAAKDKISSQLLDLPSRAPIISLTGERLPFSFVTQEVTEATCDCMLARAEEGERTDMSLAVLEKEILEEFGRCLKQIIECSNKTRSS